VRYFQHSHRTIEQAVHNLESGRLVAPHRSGMPHVTRLALACDVLEHDIGRLKDAYRQRVRPILPNRLQQAWQERRAHHLELERFGVGDLDCRLAIVGRLEPRKVFLVGTLDTLDGKRGKERDNLLGKATTGGGRVSADTYENEWQNFNPASVCPFVPDDVTELANSKRLCHRARRWERVWQVVEPVGNRCVLHDITLV
jgi:hypothetical protein